MGVYLADFGLARAVGTGPAGPAPTRVTRTGEALGTPAYMSPEQARGAGLSPASDVWALGCVAYELLAGRPPFEGELPAAIVGAVLGGRAPALRRTRRELPADLYALVHAALAVAPARRPADAGAVARELDAVLQDRPTGRSARAARRRLAGVAGAVALGLAAVAGGRAVVAGRRPPDAASAPEPAAQVLAAEAAQRRGAEPAAAAALYAKATALAPERHDWRVECGLLWWTLGRVAEARDAWALVPPDSPERPRAALYQGLAQLFSGLALPDAGPLDEAARTPGRFGALARGALAAAAERWDAARSALDGVDGWEAALLRAYVTGQSTTEREAGTALMALDRAIAETAAAGVDFAWAHALRGLCLRAEGRDPDSLAAFERAAALAPDLPGVQVEVALARGLAGDVARALAALHAWSERHPDDAAAWRARAAICQRIGDWTGAKAAAERVVALEGHDAQARYDLGLVRLRLGDAAGAEADHTAALDRDPGLALAWDNRGIARQALGRFVEAIADHTRALEIEPTHVAALVNRANARLGAGDLRGALADAAGAIGQAPELFEAWFTRSQVRFAAGDLAGALADADRALQGQPGHADGLLQRGLVFDHLERLAEAEADYAAAARIRPAWTRAWYNLGMVRRQRGDWAGAAAAYRRYLALPSADEGEAADVERLLAECERAAASR